MYVKMYIHTCTCMYARGRLYACKAEQINKYTHLNDLFIHIKYALCVFMCIHILKRYVCMRMYIF